MKARITSTIVGLAMVAGAFAGASPAAAVTGCDFEMVSLEARNLQTDNGSRRDFAWVQLDQAWFPAGGNGVEFSLGQTRTAGSFGNPIAGFGAGGLEVRVVLDKWPANVTVERETIACAAATGATRTFSNGDAVYDLEYNVTT